MDSVRNPSQYKAGIASELADIKARQALVLDFDDWLLARIDEDQFLDEIRHMRDADEKNLRLLENLEVQLGERVSPKPATQRHIELAREILEDGQYSMLEKTAELGLLKTMQVTCGTLVARALESADKDLALAASPIAGLNADNGKHLRWMKDITNEVGLFQIAGEQVDGNLWGKIKNTFASATTMLGINAAQPMEDMPITSVLALDHRKVDLLFGEVLASDDFERARNRFEGIYKDLNVHALAEEEVFYRALQDRSASNDISHAFAEHQEMKALLQDIRANPGSFEGFKASVTRLRDIVKHHVNEEEDDIFDLAKDVFSENELVLLSRRFMAHKERILEDFASRGSMDAMGQGFAGPLDSDLGTTSTGMTSGARYSATPGELSH